MEIVSTLSSFGSPVQAVVIGASGAIGGAVVDRLAGCAQVDCVLACSRKPHPHTSSKVTSRPIDILDQASIATAFIGVEGVDLAIVATGRLHVPGGMQPEKSWRSLNKAKTHSHAQHRACAPAQGCDLRRPASRHCRQCFVPSLSVERGTAFHPDVCGGTFAHRHRCSRREAKRSASRMGWKHDCAMSAN